MSQPIIILTLSLTSLLSYLWSFSPLVHFTPQLLALLSILFIVLFINHKSYIIFLISFIINLLVFTTNGLSSPVFFLIYFLLFTLAFQNPPSTTITYSLILIILLSQSLNSLISVLPLVSLVFVTPLAWFIGKQHLENNNLNLHLTKDETKVFLWFSLKFKTGIIKIIDTASLLLSNPSLSSTQKDQLHLIKDSAKSLLNSSQKLTREIDEETDHDNE